jgi:preprotein translocase subunit SecD
MRWLAVLWLLFPAQDAAVELVYRLKFPEDFKGERAAASSRALEVVRKRLEAFHPGSTASPGEGERLRIRTSTGKVADVKKTVARPGTFSLRMTAEREVQLEFARSGRVPAGFRVWDFRSQQPGEYQAWAGGKVLLAEEPAVDQGHAAKVEPQSGPAPGGTYWVVGIELNAEGARRFDEIAKVLYHRRPPGLVAILADGSIRAMPIVHAESFQGHVHLAGLGGEAECREFARILALGALPVPLELESEQAR